MAGKIWLGCLGSVEVGRGLVRQAGFVEASSVSVRSVKAGRGRRGLVRRVMVSCGRLWQARCVRERCVLVR